MIVVGILLIALRKAVIYAEFFVKKKPDITILQPRKLRYVHPHGI